MTTLVLAEHAQGVLKDSTAKTVAAAQALGGDIHVLVAGAGAPQGAQAAAQLAGVAKVLVAAQDVYAHQLAEPLAALLVHLAPSYDALLAPAGSTGKNVMPRVAALLDVMQISDMTRVLASDTFERPIYAGNAVQTVQSRDAKKVITVRTAAFKPVGEGANAPVVAVDFVAPAGAAQFVGEELAASARPDLGAAKIVISGGRALGSAEKFKELLDPLADLLGAALGASRAAVDAGYAPNDYQVGQTGKVVAPDVYIAIGISGAIQHLAGMKDSRLIVAINKDPEAPIFQMADAGLVGDIFTLLPALQSELAKVKS